MTAFNQQTPVSRRAFEKIGFRRAMLAMGTAMAGLILLIVPGSLPAQVRPNDPNQAKLQVLDRIRQRLDVTPEEWAVLDSHIDQILTLQAELQAAPGNALAGIAGRRFRNSSIVPPPPDSGLRSDYQSLHQTLVDQTASIQSLRNQLERVRQTTQEKQQELEAARKQLIALLTVRQEVILFELGIVD